MKFYEECCDKLIRKYGFENPHVIWFMNQCEAKENPKESAVKSLFNFIVMVLDEEQESFNKQDLRFVGQHLVY